MHALLDLHLLQPASPPSPPVLPIAVQRDGQAPRSPLFFLLLTVFRDAIVDFLPVIDQMLERGAPAAVTITGGAKLAG
jgi:hypothetical protein